MAYTGKALDRYITGNWGEDSVAPENKCDGCSKLTEDNRCAMCNPPVGIENLNDCPKILLEEMYGHS